MSGPERERAVIVNTPGPPATVESLVADLRVLGVSPGTTLMVHASLSAMGWVCGGPLAAVLALEEALGEMGTLAMPAHSGDLSDPVIWENPPVPDAWLPVIRAHMPAYDPDLTPTREMGAIAETFRTQPGTLRSAHPSVSFTARGPNAERITAGHSLDHAFAEDSPLARLYDLDAFVLLLGVGHDRNTSLHLAENRANGPWKRMATWYAPMMRDGRRAWVSYESLAESVDDFPQIGSEFARETGLVRTGQVGQATALLMPQRALVGFAAVWMTEHRR